MKSQIGLLLAIALLVVAPATAAEQNVETKPIPLDDAPAGDAPAGETAASAEGAEQANADDDDEEAEGWRAEVALGVHLTVPDNALDGTADLAGGGIHVFIGGRPKALPITLGAAFGFDSFLPHTEQFTYDNLRANWSIKRRGIWMLPTVSFSPADTVVRPFLRLHGGLWLHDVRIEAENEWNESESHGLGLDATGAYGASVGLDFRLNDTIRMGFSVLYLRGGGVTVPDYRNATVENGRLVIDDIDSGALSQWTFGIELSGVAN